MSRQSTNLEILIATRNAGKIREIQKALSQLPIALISLIEFPHVTSVEESGTTYQENAVLKALGYSRQTGVCALADDSGLEVDALDGGPGILSARFAGPDASDTERNEKLLTAISRRGSQDRTARFVCAMALAGWPPNESRPDNDEPRVINIAEGTCEGAIAAHPRGSNGFGFDPLFVPKGHTETFGDLSDEVKATISHRALALAEMRQFLERWLADPSPRS